MTAERAFLAGLGGGCSVPVAAYAQVRGGRLHLQGRVSGLDGVEQVDVEGESAFDESYHLGARLAQQAAAQGADRLLTHD